MDADLIRVCTLSAISVWGVMQAIKPYIKRRAASSISKSAVRLVCLALGCVWGYVMMPSAYGVAAGCSGAALSAVIVAAIKGKIDDRRLS